MNPPPHLRAPLEGWQLIYARRTPIVGEAPTDIHGQTTRKQLVVGRDVLELGHWTRGAG
jgi:hypothetical protein